MEKKIHKRSVEKIRHILFKDNIINKPLKLAIRKLGLYSATYNFLDKFEIHDEISMRIIKKLIKKDAPLVLEVGANIGQDTNRFLRAFKNIKIFSFEPDPRAIEQFLKNVDSPKSKLISIALSDKNGFTTLHLSSGTKQYVAGKEEISEWTASSTIKKPVKKSGFVKYNRDIKVKTMKLDDWVKENNLKIIDFIWADVEGSERELISGGLNALDKTRYFYTEFSNEAIYEGQPSLSEIQKMLPNFEVIGIYGSNALMKNKFL